MIPKIIAKVFISTNAEIVNIRPPKTMKQSPFFNWSFFTLSNIALLYSIKTPLFLERSSQFLNEIHLFLELIKMGNQIITISQRMI